MQRRSTIEKGWLKQIVEEAKAELDSFAAWMESSKHSNHMRSIMQEVHVPKKPAKTVQEIVNGKVITEGQRHGINVQCVERPGSATQGAEGKVGI